MPRNLSLTFVLVLMILTITACTKKVYTSLPGVGMGDLLNRATQNDIAKRYGPPASKEALSDGGAVWAYDYRSTTTEGDQASISSSIQCYRVIYVFDAGKILRDYRRERC